MASEFGRKHNPFDRFSAPFWPNFEKKPRTSLGPEHQGDLSEAGAGKVFPDETILHDGEELHGFRLDGGLSNLVGWGDD
jgi:hypothetical protein